MFKKSNTNKQLDMFSSPSTMLCGRESRKYDDPSAWHNKFFREVTCNIDEEIFRPLFAEGREGGKDGRPNAPIRILIAMSILKEGSGCSDEALFENCCFNMLYRSALGLVTLQEQCPSIDSYYTLRRNMVKYQEETGIDLFDKCFKGITRKQALEYRISGKAVRMDSKLISSNIAWYSRYEIIHETLKKEVGLSEIESIEDQLLREQALEFYNEDAQKTVYRTDSETMGKRLLTLGLVIDHILSHTIAEDKPLLRRVFSEQYDKAEDGTVSVRNKKLVSAKSVQNPNDPDAEYRGKAGKKVKGFSTNITETCDEEGKPSIITNVDVEGATTADNTYVESGVKGSEEVTGNKVETLHSDGAYQSEDNRKFTAENDIDFVANGIQGKPSRFDLEQTDDNTLQVTDKKTGEVITAIPVNDGKWKIQTENKEGKKCWRYFGREQIAKAKTRKEVESIPFEERKKRNNVEATIFQYCFHTRNNKTRYRGLVKHKMQALARCAWINVRRLLLFDLKIALQRA
jgi:hypothetical protein